MTRPPDPSDPPQPVDVVVVGGINQDVFVHVDRRPGPGETVVGRGPRTGSGGKGANMAVAAARAGAATAMCGAVGDDGAGREQVAALTGAGVDVAHVVTRAGLGTGVALISITPDGENAIVVGPGANASLAHDDVVAASAGARVVLAQTEVGAEPVVWAAEAAAASGARLVLSTAPVVPLPAAVLEAADPLVVNASEATEVLHGPGAAAEPGSAVPSAADLVRHTGARSVVVTLGGAGADVADRHGSTRVPAPEVQVVDTTGAGDVFAGALAARLAGPGSTLMGAAAAALAAASESVTRLGAR